MLQILLYDKKYHMHLFLILLIGCWFNSCCSQNSKNINFIFLDSFTSDDTFHIDNDRIIYTHTEYYLVENYCHNDTAFLRKSIDSMLVTRMYKDYKLKNEYSIIFYKVSKKTNLETVKTNRKIFDFFPNDDLLCEYSFYGSSQEPSVGFFKNSKLLNMPEDVIIKDVYPSDNK